MPRSRWKLFDIIFAALPASLLLYFFGLPTLLLDVGLILNIFEHLTGKAPKGSSISGALPLLLLFPVALAGVWTLWYMILIDRAKVYAFTSVKRIGLTVIFMLAIAAAVFAFFTTFPAEFSPRSGLLFPTLCILAAIGALRQIFILIPQKDERADVVKID